MRRLQFYSVLDDPLNCWVPVVTVVYVDSIKRCSRRYSGLARNLIRRIISPNQDDLSYSPWISFPGQQKLGKLPNIVSLAGQHRPGRRLSSGSSITAAAWTHAGTCQIYGFLASNIF